MLHAFAEWQRLFYSGEQIMAHGPLGIFLIYREISIGISCELFVKQLIHMKCQDLLYQKNKKEIKKYFKVSSAVVFICSCSRPHFEIFLFFFNEINQDYFLWKKKKHNRMSSATKFAWHFKGWIKKESV